MSYILAHDSYYIIKTISRFNVAERLFDDLKLIFTFHCLVRQNYPTCYLRNNKCKLNYIDKYFEYIILFYMIYNDFFKYWFMNYNYGLHINNYDQFILKLLLLIYNF